MNIALNKAADGRLHTIADRLRPGRPLDLSRPAKETGKAIARRVTGLEGKAADLAARRADLEERQSKAEHELARWREFASVYASIESF